MSEAIEVRGEHPALGFAARELSRYLELATGQELEGAADGPLFTLTVADASDPELPAGLGPEDDWMLIRPEGAGYLISGSNPRSVLFAAYRYLHELGFRWIRPGPSGEIIPSLSSPLKPGIHVAEKASYRYRTICIEGACSEEHVLNLIDWCAKHAMNGYFVQFHNGTCFWRNWYAHADNPYLDAEPFTPERAGEMVGRVAQELKLRGMRFERMGHGWTAAAVGLPGEGWDQQEIKLTPEQRQMLAELDGKRDLFHGVPLNTNLCYSNPDVRRKMVQTIVAYAREHPEVDILHLWLADGSNNNCECPNCQAARPSDFYVRLLNELDAALTEAGLPTRVVFLIYVDLLWPPEREKIANPERFVLMFAPITRSYRQSFAEARVPEEPLPPYRRNKLEFPKDVGMNVKFLEAWQEMFPGDGFDFDYHCIWACHYDPNHYALARVLHRDIQFLERIGLHGLNSCQVQRLFFPHSLLLDVMASTLWNKGLSFDEIARRSFSDAFGEEGERVRQFFKDMSELWAPMFEPVFEPQRDEARIAEGLNNLARMPKLIAEIEPLAKTNLSHPVPAIRKSWQYLALHLELLGLLIPAFRAYLSRAEDCRERFEKAFDFLWRREKDLHEGLDVSTFVKVQGWRINELEASRQQG